MRFKLNKENFVLNNNAGTKPANLQNTVELADDTSLPQVFVSLNF